MVQGITYACFVPKPGSGWSLDQLIENSKTIVVVELVETRKERSISRHVLKPIETLKGKLTGTIEFITHRQIHEGKDFNNHTDGEFWVDSTGRSSWPCCICGPNHTFIKGVKYLLFPDALGAIKSAEIVSSSKDKWYLYVKDRVHQLSK